MMSTSPSVLLVALLALAASSTAAAAAAARPPVVFLHGLTGSQLFINSNSLPQALSGLTSCPSPKNVLVYPKAFPKAGKGDRAWFNAALGLAPWQYCAGDLLRLNYDPTSATP